MRRCSCVVLNKCFILWFSSCIKCPIMSSDVSCDCSTPRELMLYSVGVSVLKTRTLSFCNERNIRFFMINRYRINITIRVATREVKLVYASRDTSNYYVLFFYILVKNILPDGPGDRRERRVDTMDVNTDFYF